MKNKRLISIVAMVSALTITIIACKDNFNESDFLKLNSSLQQQQDSLKLNQQIKALNDAGKLLSFTVQVNEDATPLSGVTVKISNDVNGAIGSTSVTTDDQGNAMFPSVRVGSNTVVISKSGYITATAVVDFGSVMSGTHYTVFYNSNGSSTIVPVKQASSIVMPIFASGTGSGSTATITGKVTIENDLTNATSEIPQNLTIAANFAQSFPSTANGGVTAGTNVKLLSYQFNAAGIGVAHVDNTTGIYTMTVPATASGLKMGLLIPLIQGNQKLAASYVNDLPANGLPEPQQNPEAIINTPTEWGPSVASTYDNTIPFVSGAKAIFPAPPLPGAGLNFNFTPIARPISIVSSGSNQLLWNTNNAGIDPADAIQFNIGETVYQLTSRGSGYTSSPAIAVNGGGGSGAAFKASLRGMLTNVTVTNGGTGYTGANVSVNFGYKDGSGNTFYLSSINCPVTVSAGAITSITLPFSGYGINTPWHTIDFVPNGFDVASFLVAITGGGGSGVTADPVYTSEVDHIQLTAAGTNYSSAPTFTFSGGGANATQAKMVVKEFRTHWLVTPDNSQNTQAYAVLPSAISFEYNTLLGGQALDARLLNNNFFVQNNPFTVSDGKVVAADATSPLVTYLTSATKPLPVITPSQWVQATTLVYLDWSGKVTSLNSYRIGRGYAVPPSVTIQPMFSNSPGSGAAVDLTNTISFNKITGEYSWNGPTGSIVTNSGNGYLTEINLQDSFAGTVGYSGPNSSTTFTVKTGDKIIMDVVYGTGHRKNNVQ